MLASVLELRWGLAGYSLVCLLLAGCGGRVSEADGGAGPDSGPADGGAGPDGGLWCPGPLPDAGFSSLADLPIATLCGSTYGYPNEPTESTCQGWTLVSISQGVDTDGWWLFEAATGDLKAVGFGGAGSTGPGCTGAVSGFSFPYQCFLNGWPQEMDLPCPDASGSD
jgi:hypothetical protein